MGFFFFWFSPLNSFTSYWKWKQRLKCVNIHAIWWWFQPRF